MGEQAPDASEKTWAAVIAEALLRRAVSGDVRAISELANRVEGKPLQAVDLDVNSSAEISKMTDEQLEQRMSELMEELQLEDCKK